MEYKAATFTSYNATISDGVNEWLEKGWEVQHMVSSPIGSYMRVLIIFQKEKGRKE